MSVKYIFITGGVASSLGKGLTAASIALLLEKQNIKLAMLKLDPYLNVDPGTMSPFQHGEVYVTDDGAETDLDLGHYYRYTDSPLSKASNATSGQIYDTVIKRERKGEYLGKTVQVIPHVTDEIKQRILACGQQDKEIKLVIIEIGGTVGDIESLPFLEAIRQFRYDHPGDVINIHLTYVPYLKAAGELKTKPTQHSIQLLRGIGITPDIMLCRSEYHLSNEIKDKISLFCNVPRDAVLDELDVKNSIYEVPINLYEQKLDKLICQLLRLPSREINLDEWHHIVDVVKSPTGRITVGIIGKYVQHQDAYKSVYEALEHAAISLGYSIKIKRFESDKIIKDGSVEDTIEGCDGYLVPGGFGERGWMGKMMSAQYCRENTIPFFGICLGVQVMTVEFARNVLGLKDANSTEVDPDTKHPIIALLSEQHEVQDLGGTMRLGAFPCILKKGTKVHKAYGVDKISERHRHRFEVNNDYKEDLEKNGLIFSGILEAGQLCEIAEIKDHPWMVGVQFHPEFQSKPTCPHPLFKDFVAAMIANHKKTKDKNDK